MVPSEEIGEKLKALLGDADAAAFVEFTKDIEAGTIENSTILCFDGDFSEKQKRTEVHQFFKQWMKKYETDTLSLGETRRIRVFLQSALGKNKRAKNSISTWGHRGMGDVQVPEYLSMAMQKTNFESMQAIHYISKRVKKQVKHFALCGNKDKRGTTTQRITLSRGNAEMLIRAMKQKDWDQKLKLGSFERVWSGVNLGQLKGNRFSVALRFI